MRINQTEIWKRVGDAGTVHFVFQVIVSIASSVTTTSMGIMSSQSLPYVFVAAIFAFGATMWAWNATANALSMRPFINICQTMITEFKEGEDHGVRIDWAFTNPSARPAYNLKMQSGWCVADDPQSIHLNDAANGPSRLGPGLDQCEFGLLRRLRDGERLWLYVSAEYTSSQSLRNPFTESWWFIHDSKALQRLAHLPVEKSSRMKKWISTAIEDRKRGSITATQI